jgi:AraC-like DNA-binding protein
MSTKRKLLIVGGVLAACSFAGGAYAATSDTSPRQAFLSDVAKRLHVTPQQLQSAFHGAFLDQLNQAVKAGRLTPAQADAIRRHLERRGMLPFAFPIGPPHHGLIAAAASYLGLTEVQLFDQLRAGKSLAQIAKAHGKSASGLENALLADMRAKLDRERTDGRITGSQEQRILGRFQGVISQLMTHSGFGPRFGPPFEMRPRFHFGPHLAPPPLPPLPLG